MAKFAGRKEELQALKNLINKRSASLIVIKGRRRIGKSRLLEEFSRSIQKSFVFSGLPPVVNDRDDRTNAQSQREEIILILGLFSKKKNKTTPRVVTP